MDELDVPSAGGRELHTGDAVHIRPYVLTEAQFRAVIAARHDVLTSDRFAVLETHEFKGIADLERIRVDPRDYLDRIAESVSVIVGQPRRPERRSLRALNTVRGRPGGFVLCFRSASVSGIPSSSR